MFSFFCDLCLNGFCGKDLLERHQKYCRQIEPQTVYTPEEFSKKASMEFRNVESMLRSPFVIYADIECFLDTSTKQHIPSGVGYYIVSDHPSYQGQKVKIFKGEVCKDFKDSFQFCIPHWRS